jgi:hypothetical protein
LVIRFDKATLYYLSWQVTFLSSFVSQLWYFGRVHYVCFTPFHTELHVWPNIRILNIYSNIRYLLFICEYSFQLYFLSYLCGITGWGFQQFSIYIRALPVSWDHPVRSWSTYHQMFIDTGSRNIYGLWVGIWTNLEIFSQFPIFFLGGGGWVDPRGNI